MTRMTRREFAAMAATAAAGTRLGLDAALAQNYPTRPIQLICPWGAGGGTDATARIVAALLEKDFGQPVSVVNRIGGSGVVGHSAIAWRRTALSVGQLMLFLPSCSHSSARQIAAAKCRLALESDA